MLKIFYQNLVEVHCLCYNKYILYTYWSLMKTYIVYFCIYISFYILGGYSTTDILRLQKNAALSINAPHCYCPICHQKIRLHDQMPLFAYIKNNGQCPSCHCSIPPAEFLLELAVFLPLSTLSTVLHFSWFSYLLCIVYYELLKLISIIYFKPRTTNFTKNLFFSLLNNAWIFCMIAFLFALSHIK